MIATFSREKHHACDIILPIRIRRKITSTPNTRKSKSPQLKDLNTRAYMREKKNSRTVSGNFGRGKVDHKTYKDQVTEGSNGRAARALLLRPIIHSLSLSLPRHKVIDEDR